MSKPKSNSVIEAMPENQRTQLEAWLFEENLSYVDAAKRLLADFNVRVVQSSVGRFYQRCAQRRMLDRIAQSRGVANAAVAKFRENPADMYAVLLDMAGQIAFDKAMQSEQGLDAETIFNFTKLVMAGKKQAMEAEKIALQRDRFHFDAAKAAMAKLPGLRKIAADNSLNETDKLDRARQLLFGELPT